MTKNYTQQMQRDDIFNKTISVISYYNNDGQLETARKYKNLALKKEELSIYQKQHITFVYNVKKEQLSKFNN